MEIQFPEPSVTLFMSLLNLKLAATAALRRAMTGHPDGWDDRRKDTLSFFTSKPTAEPLRLQSPRLLFSIVCTKTFKSRTCQRKTQTRSRKFLTQQEKQVKSPQSSNQTQRWRSAMFVQTQMSLINQEAEQRAYAFHSSLHNHPQLERNSSCNGTNTCAISAFPAVRRLLFEEFLFLDLWRSQLPRKHKNVSSEVPKGESHLSCISVEYCKQIQTRSR